MAYFGQYLAGLFPASAAGFKLTVAKFDLESGTGQTGTRELVLNLSTCFNVEGDVMNERRRINHTTSLEVRLAEEAKRLEAAAKKLPPGKNREEMIRKARQTETASHMTEWLTSPGLRPPE